MQRLSHLDVVNVRRPTLYGLTIYRPVSKQPSIHRELWSLWDEIWVTVVNVIGWADLHMSSLIKAERLDNDIYKPAKSAILACSILHYAMQPYSWIHISSLLYLMNLIKLNYALGPLVLEIFDNKFSDMNQRVIAQGKSARTAERNWLWKINVWQI